jgi:hypothetical protein
MASDPDGDPGRLEDVRVALAERAAHQLATTENGEWIHVVDFEATDARVRVRAELSGVPLCMTYGAYDPLEADLATADGELCGKCVAELLEVRAAPVESTSDWDAVEDDGEAEDDPDDEGAGPAASDDHGASGDGGDGSTE